MDTDSTREEHEELEELPEHAAAVIGRLAPHAFGVAVGTVAALGLFFITLAPAAGGDPHLADHIGLLSQYLYGYTVTLTGSVIAGLYGLVIGYIVGNLFARTRNFGMAIWLRVIWRRAEHHMASDLLDI
ncbi:MAG: hypothetical protein PVJ49_14395 [Acidobacteriota bacterium]|jgi:hypothetical protein